MLEYMHVCKSGLLICNKLPYVVGHLTKLTKESKICCFRTYNIVN